MIWKLKKPFFVNTKKLEYTGATKKQIMMKAFRGIIKTIVAFTNFHGGKIVIGIEDGSWKVKGIDDTDLKLKKNWDTFKKHVTEKIKGCTEGVVPAPTIRKLLHQEKTIAIIDVGALSDESLDSTTLASMDGDCYKRENGDTTKLKGNDIGRYCKQVLMDRQEKEKRGRLNIA